MDFFENFFFRKQLDLYIYDRKVLLLNFVLELKLYF